MTSYCPFYCCYLIRSLKEGHQNKVYVGSTPDPRRRLRQHNGEITQGAFKTKKHRPWEFVMLVYGFPSKIHALQFENAWQKPLQSRHIKGIQHKAKDLLLQQSKRYNNLLLTKMWAAQLLLNAKPFSMLPLKIRFIVPAMHVLFMDSCQLPAHIAASTGSIEDLMEETEAYVKKVSLGAEEKAGELLDNTCSICQEQIDVITERYLECWNCQRMKAHIACLGAEWTNTFDLVPIKGQCGSCGRSLIWGDLVQRAKIRHYHFVKSAHGDNDMDGITQETETDSASFAEESAVDEANDIANEDASSVLGQQSDCSTESSFLDLTLDSS